MARFIWASLLAIVGVAGASSNLYQVYNANLSVDIQETLGFRVHLYAPKVAKPFPLIFFVSGVGANVPVSMYSDLLTRVANKGYVVVGLDRLGIPNYPKEARKFIDVMTWAREGKLEALMAKGGFSATPDFDNTIVMAQSAGNHIVGQALADSCTYSKGFVMIDPVDGLDPLGVIKFENLITPGKKVTFTIPALLLDNGLDPKGNFAGKLPCAPIKLGSPRWYNAWRGPIWHVNATAYGHVDCLDDSWITAGGLVCPTNPKTDKAAYREHLAASSDLFIKALLDHKPENLLLLEDKSHFALDVVLEHDRKGLKDIVPGCLNVPDLTKQILV